MIVTRVNNGFVPNLVAPTCAFNAKQAAGGGELGRLTEWLPSRHRGCASPTIQSSIATDVASNGSDGGGRRHPL